MASQDKDTIYIDIDDEVTTVIDKVRASEHRIIALVLPKRATVFQSIVNMKLLKRAADDAKKSVVLITSETNLLPLAGSVGLYVAKNLQSKPEIPKTPVAEADEGEVADTVNMAAEEPTEAGDELDLGAVADKPVGELATKAATPKIADKDLETLELDNETTAPSSSAVAEAPKAKKPKKNKKLKVPNFSKFRLKLVLIALILIILIGGWVLAFSVLPKADINVKTNASALNSSISPTLDTNANALDASQAIVPAKVEKDQKTDSEQAPATGQQNKGHHASGSATMTAKKCSGNPFQSPSSVPAGTGLSVNGLTYITQSTATFSGTGVDGGGCYTYSSSSVSIVAQSPGANYNTNNANMTVNGRSDVSATGSASGGTDNVVKIVQQSDIDAATQKLGSQDASAVKQELKKRLKQDGVYPLDDTFVASKPNVQTSAKVGDTTDSVTVTSSVSYSMYGAKESDLKKLIDNDVKGQIDASKQAILDEGLSGATVKVISSTASTIQISLDTTVTVGPDLNVESLKKQVAGKKSGDIKSLLKQNEGVTDATVHFSPFWVTKAPTNTGKINLTFEKPKPPADNASQ